MDKHKKFQSQLRSSTSARPPRSPGGRFQPNPPENPEIRPEKPEIPNPPAPESVTISAPVGTAAPDPAAELSGTGPQSTSAGEELAAVIGDIHVAEPAGAPGLAVPAQIAVLSKDQFADGFVMLHQFVAGSATMVTRNQGWQALAIKDGEKEAARQASDALYRLAELYPQSLGFLLQPGSEKMMCFVMLGSYGVGKFVAVRAAVQANMPRKGPAPMEGKPLGTPQGASS